MAKLLLFVAILLVASAIVAEAHIAPPAKAPAPAPGNHHAYGHRKPAPIPAPAPPPAATKHAASVPAPTPAHAGIIRKSTAFSLKCIIHNVADRIVTFKLVLQGNDAVKAVVAKAGQWCAIEPVKVGCKVPLVHVCVTVKNNKGVAVTKTFPVKLAAFLKGIVPKCQKALVLTACEVKSWMGEKCLVIKVGRQEMLTVKL